MGLAMEMEMVMMFGLSTHPVSSKIMRKFVNYMHRLWEKIFNNSSILAEGKYEKSAFEGRAS